ncbi:MAG: hypothetical protein R2847_01580 [Bacteroidia bacterium]
MDGHSGNEFKDIEIRAKDSLWVFIEVTIDPNSSLTPYLVTDSIVFETNGNVQDVNLVAYGKNAHFITPKYAITFPDGSGLPYSIIGDGEPCGTIVEWDSLMPYVVYGYAVVDSCITLRIKEGTKIYFYNNSGLWVYRFGNLHVEGSKEHPVEFGGTRLENSYSEVLYQWDRIWINEGGVNVIDHALIKNAFFGIQAEDVTLDGVIGDVPTQLTVSNTISEICPLVCWHEALIFPCITHLSAIAKAIVLHLHREEVTRSNKIRLLITGATHSAAHLHSL